MWYMCTCVQALLANIASLYAVYHGPEGLKTIAQRCHGMAAVFAEGARKLGFTVPAKTYFDTVAVEVRVCVFFFTHVYTASHGTQVSEGELVMGCQARARS